MSAACAPATATTPAAVPRRRLFTIFISTSMCCLGRVGLRRALLTLERPLRPSPPGLSVALVGPQRHDRPVGATSGCPPRSHNHISRHACTGNEEETF